MALDPSNSSSLEQLALNKIFNAIDIMLSSFQTIVYGANDRYALCQEGGILHNFVWT